jgi:hypothetical protein
VGRHLRFLKPTRSLPQSNDHCPYKKLIFTRLGPMLRLPQGGVLDGRLLEVTSPLRRWAWAEPSSTAKAQFLLYHSGVLFTDVLLWSSAASRVRYFGQGRSMAAWPINPFFAKVSEESPPELASRYCADPDCEYCKELEALLENMRRHRPGALTRHE